MGCLPIVVTHITGVTVPFLWYGTPLHLCCSLPQFIIVCCIKYFFSMLGVCWQPIHFEKAAQTCKIGHFSLQQRIKWAIKTSYHCNSLQLIVVMLSRVLDPSEL